jgi:hypothetical protein
LNLIQDQFNPRVIQSKLNFIQNHLSEVRLIKVQAIQAKALVITVVAFNDQAYRRLKAMSSNKLMLSEV